MEVFIEILQICPRLPDQEFDEPPSEEEILSFIKELGHIGKIKNITAVQTYFAFAVVEATPKPKRMYKKTVSPTIKTITKYPKETPSKKKTAPAKKDISSKKPSRKQSTGVQIKDTLGVSMSKKKAPVTTDKSKGIEFLSEATLLEYAQMKKALKKSKLDTNIHQASGSSEGADFELEVPDKPSEGTGVKPWVPDVSKAYSSNSENESWGDSRDDEESDDDGNYDDNDNDDGDNDSDDVRTKSDDDKNDVDQEEEYEEEYVPTPKNYESTDDEYEHVDEEDYEELYKDVNVRLKYVEQGEEGKGDAEKTDLGLDDVTQETTYEQVKGDEHVTLTTVHDTQKTEVPLQSSSVSSDFASQFLNLDNSPPTNTEIISMMNVDVHHEEPNFIEKSVKDIINDEVKTQLPQILPKAVSDFETPMIKSTITESLEDVVLVKSSSQPQSTYEATKSLTEFELNKILIDKMEKNQMNLIADVYGKAVSLKRGREDKDKDEDPLARSDQGMKRRKKIKDDEPSTGPKSKESKPPQTWISKIAQAKKSPLYFNRLMSTPIDFSAYVMNHLKIDRLTQEHLIGPTFNLVKGACKSHVELEYNFEECYKALTLRMFTRRIVILKRVEDLQLGVKSYQKKLNITKPQTFKLMPSDELYKFSDGTLTSVRTVLHDIALNLRRLMRSLEKFVGGRDYEDDLRLLERTI
ncbi:hypothetical protein Tco_0964359 [Tanacetum coccineum]